MYPVATVGAVEMPPSLPYADPLDLLAFVAAATDRLLLGTGVLLLPYHHPVVLAKRLATIDVLSKGRMRLLTVGLGGLPGEATAVGVDFRSRGRRADEAIDVLRLLWGGDADGVSFHGEFFDFERVCSFPKLHGATALPIHVGGSSRAAARRVGLRGDGYFPGGRLTPDERAAQWELTRSVAAEAGRDPDALEYTRWGSTELSAQRVEAYAAQGVTRIVVGSGADTLAEQRDDLSGFADRFGLRPTKGDQRLSRQ
ncbi:TIGR03619 family F420-dependent LLM class oxidoreductase [Solwaraspora sp. WMMD937]|uniref:TIGR03619 family F420-dependent LLM class oxidoreductase n=1 Tax=Solwaraspora sp. WMMD937 TaxID=3016090 RepID=UPI00249B38CA|nr:TIGR03619 family F420-dependent LLM class oxidoreductase [Solwaraspora sp. WMMD937]WFE19725.1 TIGR03619 family F420-dependent LLM class oxidoreductase [Solwaraspora sp. WMMD937]